MCFIFSLPPICYLKLENRQTNRICYLERMSHYACDLPRWEKHLGSRARLPLFFKEWIHYNETLWSTKISVVSGSWPVVSQPLTLAIINCENPGYFSDLWEGCHFRLLHRAPKWINLLMHRTFLLPCLTHGRQLIIGGSLSISTLAIAIK